MVDIKVQGDEVHIEVLGIHKLWAFKSHLVLRKNNITEVKIVDKSLRPAPIRMPGVYIPRIIAAGTFYGKKRKEFWDANFKGDAIEITLSNEKYSKIVVNVTNPVETLKLLSSV